MESFQITPASQLGSHCICMQLKTFGPNERVTLGTNTTITAAGFWTLCYIISCGSGSEHSFPNCISTFQCSDVSGCSWIFFLDAFSSRETWTSSHPEKDHSNTNLPPIKLFTFDTGSLALRKTATYTGFQLPNTESVQLVVWVDERNYSNCFLSCSTISMTVFDCFCHDLFGMFRRQASH